MTSASPLEKLRDFLRLLDEKHRIWSRYTLPSPGEIDDIRRKEGIHLPLEPVGREETAEGRTLYRVRVSPSRVQGVRRPDGSLEVESVTLRHVHVPPGGRPIVAFCKKCGRIASYWRVESPCPCGSEYIGAYL